MIHWNLIWAPVNVNWIFALPFSMLKYWFSHAVEAMTPSVTFIKYLCTMRSGRQMCMFDLNKSCYLIFSSENKFQQLIHYWWFFVNLNRIIGTTTDKLDYWPAHTQTAPCMCNKRNYIIIDVGFYWCCVVVYTWHVDLISILHKISNAFGNPLDPIENLLREFSTFLLSLLK